MKKIRLLPKAYENMSKKDRTWTALYFVGCGMLIGAGEIILLIALGL